MNKDVICSPEYVFPTCINSLFSIRFLYKSCWFPLSLCFIPTWFWSVDSWRRIQGRWSNCRPGCYRILIRWFSREAPKCGNYRPLTNEKQNHCSLFFTKYISCKNASCVLTKQKDTKKGILGRAVQSSHIDKFQSHHKHSNDFHSV
jgi:hypothetical protein